jgi:hypothetical protein
MENYTRRVIHKDGRIEEVQVSKKEVDKKIKTQLKEDQEMLKILEKL